jgi:molybdopterin-guanine dinucleotide biosynthesis protein A
MIDRVAAALSPVVDTLMVVANAPDAASWLPGTRVVTDVLQGGGSAAGVHAALRAAGGPTLVVAWDMPFVTTALLDLITGGAARETDAVAPAGRTRGEFEPMCAWYAPRCADEIEAGWAADDRSLHGLLRRVSTVVVPAERIATLGSPERFFFNVNTEDDVLRARQLAADDSVPRPA